MTAMVSQISSLTIVYQRKRQSSTSLAFVRGIHLWLVDSPHKGPVTRKMSPFDDVIMFALKTAADKATLKNIGKNKAEIHQLVDYMLFLPIFFRVDLQALGHMLAPVPVK